MEMLRLVVLSLSLQAWASLIDLKEAYLHIPIRPVESRYLCFIYDGRLFEFTANKIANTIVAFLH